MTDADAAALLADALDRRAALAAVVSQEVFGPPARSLQLADLYYRWLRLRDTLRPAALTITAGTPGKEGTPPMATTFNLQDDDEVTFSLQGADAKGAPTGALPDGTTAAWSLADPDGSGAVLTPSADGLTAVLSGGQPDANLMVSVAATIPNPDGTTATLNGAEAVIVTAGPATSIAIVPGNVTPETS